MHITIDSDSHEPLYTQIRDQVIVGIALGKLTPGMKLPSVRSLASDLGINLHTVNRAYAVLRDEGYIRMRGRSGAFIAKPDIGEQADREAKANDELRESLFQAALTFRANGGSHRAFLEIAAVQATYAFGSMPEESLFQRETPVSKALQLDPSFGTSGSTLLRKRHFDRL